MAAFVLLATVATVFYKSDPNSFETKPSPSPIPTPEPEDLKLDAEITFSPGYIHIKNIEDRSWRECIYFFNDKFRYPSGTVDFIKDDYPGMHVGSGKTVSLPSDGFLTNNGLVFDVSLAKPDYFLIECLEGRGRYYLE